MTQQRNKKIEQTKAKAAKWELKSKELAYKQQLIAEYEKLQKRYEQEEDIEILPIYGRIHDRE